MKREKRKLASLKVKSFVTDLNDRDINTLKGGSSGDETPPTTTGHTGIDACYHIQ